MKAIKIQQNGKWTVVITDGPNILMVYSAPNGSVESLSSTLKKLEGKDEL